ncbi:MAG: DNA adenine methylase [Candidatus Thermoplasmatota archaeon]|jgi:DNA adenine methylase|nr:DNA adenine methylase [Candidatus Thermoplasmatota archaeon]
MITGDGNDNALKIYAAPAKNESFQYIIEPIIKWAGGKRQIIDKLLYYMPSKWNTYFEPFLGGGALVSEIYRMNRLKSAVLSDKNFDIYNLFSEIRNNPEELIKGLNNLDYRNLKESYYEARSEFNSIRRTQNLRRAIIFIYLNRHAFNGLYRLNSRGEFNVPFGRYTNPHLPSSNLVHAWFSLLKNVDLRLCDFQSATKDANAGDFVYFDPPYTPISKSSNFTAYIDGGFSYMDQIRLAEEARRLDSLGVQFMLSNSDTEETRKLYSSFNVHGIKASRLINSKAERRQDASEIIVTNYA